MIPVISSLSCISEKFYIILARVLNSNRLGKWFLKRFTRLKAIQVLKSPDRISSLDILRAGAIIPVVFYHFQHYIQYGFLGVDLFFVISGLLVGGLLTKEFEKNRRINIPKFLLQRGFKIWPSYYFFLIVGSILVILFYRNTHPDHIIPFSDSARFIFFYQNYVAEPVYRSFDHVWSLCVEEHFYIGLPIIFLTIQTLFGKKSRTKALYSIIILAILLGITFKFISFFYLKSIDIYKTHNRIDALAWGVLLNLLITHYGEKLKKLKYLYILSVVGLAIIFTAVTIDRNLSSEMFRYVVLHSVVAIGCFLLIMGIYYQDLSKFYLLRSIGYFSYNWYLWHMVFVEFIADNVSHGKIGLSIYVVTSFLMAALATILIEEPFLGWRKIVLTKLFKNK